MRWESYVPLGRLDSGCTSRASNPWDPRWAAESRCRMSTRPGMPADCALAPGQYAEGSDAWKLELIWAWRESTRSAICRAAAVSMRPSLSCRVYLLAKPGLE